MSSNQDLKLSDRDYPVEIIPIGMLFIPIGNLILESNSQFYPHMLNKHRYRLPDIIASLLILLFCYTAITKLIEHELFKIVIAQSELISKMSGPISWTLPFGELTLSIVLLVPRWRQSGFMIAFCLLTLFTVYILYMLLFASERPCSCGGVLKNLSWPQHIVFNLFFASLAFIGWQTERKNKQFFQNPVH